MAFSLGRYSPNLVTAPFWCSACKALNSNGVLWASASFGFVLLSLTYGTGVELPGLGRARGSYSQTSGRFGRKAAIRGRVRLAKSDAGGNATRPLDWIRIYRNG